MEQFLFASTEEAITPTLFPAAIFANLLPHIAGTEALHLKLDHPSEPGERPRAIMHGGRRV